MSKVAKCKVILCGFFSLPDVFVERENILQKRILEEHPRTLYENRFNWDLVLENFDGPRQLPLNREQNKFWRSMLGYGFWVPLFYISSNKLKVKFTGCDESDSESLFEKVVEEKFRSNSRFHIRVFPIGGFSIQMITSFKMSFDKNEFLTLEDLEKIVCEFFDSINVDLFKKDERGYELILKSKTTADLFRILGNMVRTKFLNKVDEYKYLGMTQHAVLDINEFKGDWSADEIKRLCGLDFPISTTMEDLLKNQKIGNPYDKFPIKGDIRFSGETCTLVCTQDMEKKGRKYNIDEIYDVIELIYLRKLMVEEYRKFIKQNSLEIAKKHSTETLLKKVWDKIRRKKLTWIDEVFLTSLRQLIELDDAIQNVEFRKNYVSKISERINQKKMLEALEADLVHFQGLIEKYNQEISEKVGALASVVKEIISLLPQ